jgi:hypothetical protein
MGLRLIKTDEKLVYDGEGFKIYYRRLPNHVRAGIVKRHTKRGIVDFYGASVAQLEYCVTGWENVYEEEADGKRKDIGFDQEKIRYIPDDVQADLLELIGAAVETLDKDAENLEATSDNNTKTGE